MLQQLHKQISEHQAPGGGRISEISANIFICPLESIGSLGTYEIVDVLQIMPERRDIGGIAVVHIPCSEHEDLPRRHGREVYEYLLAATRSNRKVAIMCTTGRTQSFVALAMYNLRRAYELSYMRSGAAMRTITNREHMYLPTIVKYVQKSRPCIGPSMAQLEHLANFENAVKSHFVNAFLQQYRERIAGWPETSGDAPTVDEYLSELFSPPPSKVIELLPTDKLDELGSLITGVI